MSVHVLVTGASGYIGRRFVEAAVADGCRVTVLGRTPVMVAEARHFPWELGQRPTDEAFAAGGGFPAVDTVLHLAHQWQSQGDEADVNVVGTDLLLAAARAHNVRRFLFTSSISSRPDALNRYGRVKWAIEQRLQAPAELAARIGLVYGGPERGIWGSLCGLAGRWPVLPMIDPWRRVQPIHVDDACRGLLVLARLPSPTSSVYVLADEASVPFGGFLRLLAREKFGKRCRVVPVPSALVLPVVGLIERLPGLPRVDRERLLGLAGARVMASGPSLSETGLRLRPLAAGLAGEMMDRRRRLLDEGHVLIASLLGARPPASMVRLYVKSVEAARDQRPFRLPAPLRWWPALVRASEPLLGGVNAERARARLHLAAMVVDASPEGAAKIYDYQGTSALRGLLRLFGLGLAEAALIPIRLVLAGVVWR